MPSRADISFLRRGGLEKEPYGIQCVNALSGLYLISTNATDLRMIHETYVCQCPLGLITHFYSESQENTRLKTEVCQYPLGLIPHFY